jgi:APA family basic amino acid/polyamine antiporter
MAESDKHQLIRGLTLTDTTALVVGTVIGTGVFLKTSVMAQQVGTRPWSWPRGWPPVSCRSRRAHLRRAGRDDAQGGGEYVYLRSSYGEDGGVPVRLAAFHRGRQRFGRQPGAQVSRSSWPRSCPSTPCWAQHKFSFLGQELDWQFGPGQVVAVGGDLLSLRINCLTVAFGGRCSRS